MARMFSTYPYPANAGLKLQVPNASFGPVNKTIIPTPLFGKAEGEYVNGVYDDKEYPTDMCPATYPVAAYMNGGSKRMYLKGELIRFTQTSKRSGSRAKQLETRAPHPYSDFHVQGATRSSAVTFVAPLAETQELIPGTSQFVSICTGGVADILVPASNPGFIVFPGDRVYARISGTDTVEVTARPADIELGVVAHHYEHKGTQNVVRVCLK